MLRPGLAGQAPVAFFKGLQGQNWPSSRWALLGMAASRKATNDTVFNMAHLWFGGHDAGLRLKSVYSQIKTSQMKWLAISGQLGQRLLYYSKSPKDRV